VLVVAAALAVGALVGLVSGLTGIGGGVLMVPFLYVLYDRLGVPRNDATPMAHATSLAVIVPTAIRGLIGYRGTGLVQWRAALPLAATGALSAAVTAQFAARLPAQALRVGFGIFLALVSLDLLFRTTSRDDMPDRSAGHLVWSALLGIPVGALSAALGVGGGVPATMGMHYLLEMPFRVIVPTSLAVITVTGTAGSASYLFEPVRGLPFTGVVGHVDFRHGLPLAIGAVLLSPLGVRINRRMPVLVLRRVFGVLLLAIGANLIVANV
jgi:uncharacterized membrane protein YfcA